MQFPNQVVCLGQQGAKLDQLFRNSWHFCDGIWSCRTEYLSSSEPICLLVLMAVFGNRLQPQDKIMLKLIRRHFPDSPFHILVWGDTSEPGNNEAWLKQLWQHIEPLPIMVLHNGEILAEQKVTLVSTVLPPEQVASFSTSLKDQEGLLQMYAQVGV